jgi:glycosyltransferase involved in cell wall biosynthesis
LSIAETDTSACSGRAAEAARRSLAVVVPMLNEEQGLARLVERLRATLDGLDLDWEVIFVDDGSTDGTLAELRATNARDPRFKAIALSRNFGKEIAIAAGLSYVKTDAAVLMDADLQHPPELIGKFVEHWCQGFDIVYAQRADRAADSTFNRWAARAFYATFRHLSGTTLPEGAGDFRLLDRKAVDAMNRMRERNRFNKGLFAWMGFKAKGVPYHVAPRPGGASRWRPGQLFRFGIDGLTAFTTIPLRVWSYLGVAISLFAVGYAVVVTIQTLLWGTDVPGYPSLIVSVMFFAGVQLISLGVIGEYLGRMYEEVKGRPLFLVTEELGLERAPGNGTSPEREPAGRDRPGGPKA